HILTVRISDLEGLTVTGEIRARVVSELSGVVISPPAVSLSVNASQDFHAGLVDQFGSSIEDSSTVFEWATGGGGPIDSNGLFTAFQAGGPFGVTATYVGFSGTANITVTPANATVSLSNLNQDYDGLPKSAVITTDPSGVDVSVTYDGSPDPPVAAGTFSVEAVVTDPNYQGQASGNLSVSSNFLYWQTLEFTQEEIDNGLADPTVDNDEDGLVHLLEYALGTDPNIFTSGLEWHLVDGGNGEPRFELEFTRPIGLPDISYFIDAAESPGSASKETLSNFNISPIENTDMEKVVVRDDLVAPGAVRRFLWLRIERN
ncbi:MAG: MBG domain-containing protein, partial [Verrucomicrobiales bacterium]|nr:MBG domain-containing protein [Verrucomicrobiales bacterium]